MQANATTRSDTALLDVRWVDPETVTPLLIGLVIALLLHIMLLPPFLEIVSSSPRDLSEGGPSKVKTVANNMTPAVMEQIKKALDKPKPLEEQKKKDEPKSPEEKAKAEPEPETLPLGKNDAPERVTVAWVSYDDFQELIAPKADVEQPAVQMTTEPTPEAQPLVQDVTPPAPKPSPRAIPAPQAAQLPDATPTLLDEPARKIEVEPGPPATDTPKAQVQAKAPIVQPGVPRNTEHADTPDPAVTGVPQDTRAEQLPVPTATARDDDATYRPDRDVLIGQALKRESEGPTVETDEEPINMVQSETADPMEGAVTKLDPIKTPNRQGDPLPAEPLKGEDPEAQALPNAQEPAPKEAVARNSNPTPQKKPQLQPAPVSRPTSAAYVDKEAQPYILDEKDLKGRIGGVLVTKGIEIKTVTARFSAVTQALLFVPGDRTSRAISAPGVPRIRLTFDTDGRVLDAKLLRSSGYDNIDAPIISSMFKWRAEGDLLTRRDRPVVLEFDYRMVFK